MFILNKKTGTVQECHNNDAIKVCRKDTDNYSVAEKREDLLKEHAEEPRKEPEKEEEGNYSTDTKKDDSEAAEAAQDGENGEGKGRQESEGGAELTEEELNALKVEDLRAIAKEKKIQGYGNMNKQTLVAMILNH